MHIPVLTDEVLSFFYDVDLKAFVDCTLGLGGHSQVILQTHPEINIVIGIDQDDEAISKARENLSPFKEKIKIVKSNFCHLNNILVDLNINGVDGILFDLGVSSMHLDLADRGFSFSKDGPLDMRMDLSNDLTAQKIVNTYSEDELGQIFREYGEDFRWRAAAKKIVEERKKKRITSTLELEKMLYPLLARGRKKIRTHPVTRIFQALRICVNDELNVLKSTLNDAIELLNSGGRIGVISFHSLEDRIVKHTFKSYATKENKKINILTKKPICASNEEQKINRRSRSAKLRFAEKL